MKRTIQSLGLLAILTVLTSACPRNNSENEMAGLLTLPTFSDCQNTIRPVLPDKWTSTALMQDFVLPFLTFAAFEYDSSAAAFRFSLTNRYGIDLDFLVTEDRTLYLIEGGDAPSSCSLVSKESPFTVPSQSWLDEKAVCVGEAPILENNLAWWKTPSGQGANWIWYDAESQLPFRSMYYEDESLDGPVPIFEHFTFNYFPTFQAVSSTDVPSLLQYCQQHATEGDIAEWDRKDIDGMLEVSTYPNPAVSEETFAKAQSWIPGLTQCESPSDLPPPWPEQVQGTVFMTAVSFNPNPFPTRVFYDWTQKAQNTSLYYYPEPTAPDGDNVQVALLTGDTGYIRIADRAGAITMCEQALPGPQVPDWQTVDGCECRAQLAPGTTLNPGDSVTNVLWCPTDLSAAQVFWTWYSDEGTPIVFMQTNSSPTAGTGLNLADYYHWEPGSVAPAGTFDLPAACEGKQKIKVPEACHNCHLPTNR